MEREWENEPNRKEWEHAGFKCVINRTSHSGALCGYVGIPEEHPAYGKDYNDLPDFDVHGGLTFSKEGDGQYAPRVKASIAPTIGTTARATRSTAARLGLRWAQRAGRPTATWPTSPQRPSAWPNRSRP